MTSEWINNPQITRITREEEQFREQFALGFGYSDAG